MKTLTGLNVQCPWSNLLIDGVKSVETRSYPLPERLEGVELALIETPGKSAKFKSRIIGTITFSHSFKYESVKYWESDFNRHRVNSSDKDYGWKNDKDKYGWVVSQITKFNIPLDPPKKRGIIYSKACVIR